LLLTGIGLGPEQSFETSAENGCFEPITLDAALRTNVRFSRCGQKRDKIKPSFAKGLWHKIFQGFRASSSK
jgi:hypothetical protein